MKKMKKYLFFCVLLAAALLVACQGGTNKEKKHNPKFDNPADIEGKVDTTMYTLVNSVDSDSIEVKVLETGRVYRFSITPAKVNNAIWGDIEESDTIAIMPDLKSKSIVSSINLNCLYGLWMFKDKDGEGLRLLSDGGAMAIGWDSDVLLRRWKIYNGMLYLYTIPADGSDYDELPFECSIEYVSDERFVFNLQGDRYDCYKQKGRIEISNNN